MLRSIIVVLATFLVLLASACEHPSEEECSRICWKAGELAYWKQVEDKMAAAKSDEDKQTIRVEAEAKWAELKNQAMNPELTRCLLTCQKQGRPKQVQCIDAAESYADVQKCMEM